MALELVARREGERVLLVSPGVGEFTAAVPAGRLLGPGAPAGRLVTLGRSVELVVPAGAAGVVRHDSPGRVGAAVDCGAVDAESGSGSGAPCVRAPQAGRFYHRASPSEAPLAAVGRALAAGTPIGLIEVMKTFTHVTYVPGGTLPKHARIARVVAADGADVAEGAVLVEVEGV